MGCVDNMNALPSWLRVPLLLNRAFVAVQRSCFGPRDPQSQPFDAPALDPTTQQLSTTPQPRSLRPKTQGCQTQTTMADSFEHDANRKEAIIAMMMRPIPQNRMGLASPEDAEECITKIANLVCKWLWENGVPPSVVSHETFELLVWKDIFAYCGISMSMLTASLSHIQVDR